MDARFVISTFAPVTDCEITARLGCFFKLPNRLEDFDTLGDQIFRYFLTTGSLIRAALKSSQSANSQQYLRLHRLVETIELRRAHFIGPKLTKSFASAFVFARLFELFG